MVFLGEVLFRQKTEFIFLSQYKGLLHIFRNPLTNLPGGKRMQQHKESAVPVQWMVLAAGCGVLIIKRRRTL